MGREKKKKKTIVFRSHTEYIQSFVIIVFAIRYCAASMSFNVDHSITLNVSRKTKKNTSKRETIIICTYVPGWNCRGR